MEVLGKNTHLLEEGYLNTSSFFYESCHQLSARDIIPAFLRAPLCFFINTFLSIFKIFSPSFSLILK